MFDMISKIFSGKADPAGALHAKEQAAKLLQMSPEALDAFEAAYQKNILDAGYDSGNLFDTSAKQAAGERNRAELDEAAKQLTDRIVNELLVQTPYLDWNGEELTTGQCLQEPKALPGRESELPAPVTNADIMAMPEPMRPQLAGNLIKKDIGEPAYQALLMQYDMWKNAKTPAARKQAYHMFRQGLDILDLDPVTYEILGMNRNAMGHWLPALCSAVKNQDFFKVPKTRVIKVPMPMLQLSRLDYGLLTPATLNIVDRFCFKAFGLEEDKEYFIKTGTFSSKFDFRNAHVHGPKEVRELGEYLVFISNQAVLMAGPLSQPSIYGVSTTNEWVVREFIPDVENNTTIYKGLPLRTEYRVFVDVDNETVLGMNPYWDPELMKQRFGHEPDADSPHQVHDYITYRANEDRLMARYQENKDAVREHIAVMLPDMKAAGLTGQWSVDVMQNGNEFYVIDMALAETSALSHCVPKELLKHEPENWLPKLKAPAN